MVRFASLFNVKDQTVMFLSRTTYSLQELGAMGMGDLLNAMFDFSEKLNSLALTEEELGLFTAVVLVSAGRSSSRLSLTWGRRRTQFNSTHLLWSTYSMPGPALGTGDTDMIQTHLAWETRLMPN